jgi:hypothetical protein
MKNILFYGNCQLEKIKDILCLSSDKFNLNFIPCFLTEYTDIEFDWIIKNSDIIITQPIVDNYRNKYYLSSNYVVNKCKENAIIIFLNNCHFDFYYIDLKYKSDKYCHEYIIDCINNNKDVDHYKKMYVENSNLKTKDELQEIFDKNINNLKKRYEDMFKYRKQNTYFITIIPFIEKNYKDKLLFYTFNHPTKYLLQYIALEIIKILHIPNTIDYHLDPFSQNEKCILYSCIQKMVNFDIRNHAPYMNNCNNISDIFHYTKEEYVEGS